MGLKMTNKEAAGIAKKSIESAKKYGLPTKKKNKKK
ncbi:hypothetical protein J2S17_005410 [Cytobacillus purgationiresistens]|uniref:Uncharacterized protein n=1 Tax=Cytobacillus purgationiresistens TaxID=863449 RepID=A0ABU0AQC4_9BACI|nr:hypothetical protein [Cytobacillus purgationiresistens]